MKFVEDMPENEINFLLLSKVFFLDLRLFISWGNIKYYRTLGPVFLPYIWLTVILFVKKAWHIPADNRVKFFKIGLTLKCLKLFVEIVKDRMHKGRELLINGLFISLDNFVTELIVLILKVTDVKIVLIDFKDLKFGRRHFGAVFYQFVEVFLQEQLRLRGLFRSLKHQIWFGNN